MNRRFRLSQAQRCVGAVLAGLALTIASGAYALAQDAPQNDAAAPQTAPGPASPFNWHDIPVNETVPIQRASFDAGGYQLLDSQGQTIIVPFVNNSLYVMKFAQSTNGTMYFVNDGTAPILYVPQGAYVQNLTVAGAFWYPPSPVYPVYYGIAPSWDAYVAMGWYPGMHYWGGYWYSGGVYVATPGLYFEIGGSRYVGWARYDRYYHGHEGWRHVGYRDRGIYHRGYGSRSDFHGGHGAGRPAGDRYAHPHGVAPATGGSNRYTQHALTNSIHGPGAGGGNQKPTYNPGNAAGSGTRTGIGAGGSYQKPGNGVGSGMRTGTGVGGSYQRLPYNLGNGVGSGPRTGTGAGGVGQRPTYNPSNGSSSGPRTSPPGGTRPSSPRAPAPSAGSGGNKKH